MQEEEYYSVEQVAKMLGLKVPTIREYIKHGDLQAYRFGKVLRIKKEDFIQFTQSKKIRKDE
jgi:excisionase family DNA binding protein